MLSTPVRAGATLRVKDTVFRHARAEDAIEVAGVHVRMWQVAYGGIVRDGFLNALSVQERASRYTLGSSDPTHLRTIVALRDRIPVGRPRRGRPPASCSLSTSICPPGGQGWAPVTRRSVCAIAVGRFRRAILWVLRDNEAGQRMYRGAGWQADGAWRRGGRWGADAEVVRFRRTLG